MTFTWQSVTKNIHAHNLGLKFSRKLDKIKTQVTHFSQDSVHLNIALEKNSRKELYTAALTLHLPSNILHAEKRSPAMMTAFDQAADALVREIVSLKADLGGDYQWEQKGRRAILHANKGVHFIADRSTDGEMMAEVLGQMLEQHRQRLLHYVARQIHQAQTSGNAVAMDAEAIVNEVANRVLHESERKGGHQTYRLWFYLLAQEELERRIQAAGRLNGEAAIVANRKFEPPISEPLAELLPASQGMQAEVFEHLQGEVEGWTDPERAVFELHFLEGFKPEEVGALTRMDAGEVGSIIARLTERVGQATEWAAEAEMEEAAKGAG